MKTINELFDGWLEGSLSAAEAQELLDRLGEAEGPWPAFLNMLLEDSGFVGLGTEEQRERVFRSLMQRAAGTEIATRPRARNRVLVLRYTAIAAAVLMVLGVGYWWLRPKAAESVQSQAQAVRFHNDIAAPAGSRTTLTLAGGRVVTLDSVADGAIAAQAGMTVKKADSVVTYMEGKGVAAAGILYNTLTTARGGQTMVVLADGTKVWLNAMSSLRYPVAFGDGERRVELTGEAYFEVSKKAGAPFRVEVARGPSGQEGYSVEVLGTAFDINAYPDESASRVTLLEGAVNVALPSGHDQRISPGNQAQIAVGQPVRVISNADLEAAIAWKNGLFLFHSVDLATILRQAARWYDIEVDDQRGSVPTRFNGEVPRNTPVSDLLKAMELSGEVKFAIVGKKITVLK